MLAAAVVWTAVSGAVVAAPANDPLAAGIALRKAGDDQGALPLFEKGYRDTHAPRAAAQLGLCEQALGRWLDAETHITEALKADDDPWVRKNRATLDKALVVTKSRIGRLEITGEPTGADVLVNGIEIGKLPLAEPIRVVAGEVQVELQKSGHQPASRTITVAGGAYQKIALRAQREAVTPPPPAPTPAPASEPSVTETTASATVTATDEGPPTNRWRVPVRWVSLGLGAASLGVGVYGVLQNRSIVDNKFDPNCGISPRTGQAELKTGSTSTAEQCSDWKRQYETASTIGVIGLIGAGVFVTAGVVLWLTDPEPGAVRTALTHCGLAPGPDQLAARCLLTF